MTRAERRGWLWRLSYILHACARNWRMTIPEASVRAWDSWYIHDAAATDNPGWAMPSPIVAYRLDRELDEQHERLGR